MKDKIRKLYVEEGLTQEEIAKEFGVTQAAISYHIKDTDIDTRHRDWSPVPIFHTASGYPYWQHQVDGSAKSVYIHRLLAVAEYGYDKVVGRSIHHKNGIKWDNRPENIEVVSEKEHRKRHIGERDYSFLEEMDRDESGRLLAKEST